MRRPISSTRCSDRSTPPVCQRRVLKATPLRPRKRRILIASAAAGEVSADDKAYLGQLVAARTRLSQPEATARVDAVLAQVQAAKVKAQQAAEAARKASATFALVGALSMIIGAFVASVPAALGGKQRDDDEVLYLTARR